MMRREYTLEVLRWHWYIPRQANNLDDSEPRALAVETYITLSSSRDVLNNLRDNAQTDLKNTRHAVSNAAHSFALLRRSLERQLDNKTMTQTSNSKFSSAERSDLAEAQTSLAATQGSEAASKNSRAQVASDHEASVKALTDATQVFRSENDGFNTAVQDASDKLNWNQLTEQRGSCDLRPKDHQSWSNWAPEEQCDCSRCGLDGKWRKEQKPKQIESETERSKWIKFIRSRHVF